MKTLEQRVKVLENAFDLNTSDYEDKSELESFYKELVSLKSKNQVLINVFGLGLKYNSLLYKIKDLLDK